jgi:membrane dipeptidase
VRDHAIDMGGIVKQKHYDGYRAYSYLEAGVDYPEIDLAPQSGRVPAYDPGLTPAQQARADELLDKSVVISLHDHPSMMPADVTRSREHNRNGRQFTAYEALSRSGMDAFFDNFMDGAAYITSAAGWKWTDIVHDIGMRFADLAHQRMLIRAERTDDIRRAHRDGLIALVPGLEAATPIENEIDRIDVLYGLGIRQMGIVYSQGNGLGSGHREARDGGLTWFGKRAVERMNKLGVAIDLSHAGDETTMDAIEHSTRPVLITHAGARGAWNTRRMKPDAVLTALAERGGVIGIEAAPNATASNDHPRHTIESVMDHFRYLVDLIGIGHVAFGPDTNFGDHWGLFNVTNKRFRAAEMTVRPDEQQYVDYVEGLENPAECFPNLVGMLVKQGYSDDEIKAAVGGNILRVLDDIWV